MNARLDCSQAWKSVLAGAGRRGGTAVLRRALLILLCGWLANAGAADSTPAVFTETGIDSGVEPLADEVDIDDIHFGPEGCSYRNPEITISPAEAQRAAPGSALEFTVIVTNTSSYGCDITNFDLSASAPSGWNVRLDNETLRIAPEWSTGVLEMVITSPPSAQSGRYEIALSAGNRLLSLETTATAGYVVDSGSTPLPPPPQPGTPYASDRDVSQATLTGTDVAGPVAGQGLALAAPDTCVRSRPGLNLSPAPAGSVPETGFIYTISLTNNDPPACADSHFDLTVTFLPAGWKGRLSARRLRLAPGGSDRTILAVTPSATVASGRYQIQVGVSDAQSPEHARISLASQRLDTATSPSAGDQD